jgi:two-component system sensor histidine kinase DctS
MSDALLSLPRSPGDGSGPGAPRQWYATRVAVGLFVAALLALLWILHRQERDDSRTALVRDVLWVEQKLQYGLERNVEDLRQLAQDVRGPDLDPRLVEARVEQFLAGTPGLTQIVLLDPDGRLRAVAPGPTASYEATPPVAPRLEAAYRLALATGTPTYGPPALVGGEHHVDVFVPVYRHGALAGTVVGVYGLRPLLSGLVPWWLAEKHRVTLRDAEGKVLAARSNVGAAEHPELTHQVLLEPPGHGLRLHVTSYRSDTKLVRNVLALSIVGLAGAVLWSMWSLRRHVHRRLETEQELRREHAFRKAMEDSLETGMRAVDLEGRIIYVNPAFCRMVGYSEAELIGHAPPLPYWPSEQVGRIQASIRLARSPESPRTGTEYEFLRRGGGRFDALLYEAPLVDAHGRQTGWMASVLDITERKRARERARQQEEKLAATARLVTMGEMASAIAHELNQPLSAIASYTTGCLNLMASGAATPGEVRTALEKTSEQAQRAGRIIRRVHQFVRKSEPTRTRVRLHAVIDEAVGFAQAEARSRRVKIRSGFADDDVELDADPVLLQQVLLNLLRNGMEAMASTPPESREILVATERADSSVTVRVADRGCGIPAEVQGKLFEPFFTTKAEGMGMGLNICRSIVEIHRGRVWVEPGPGGGTVFSFSLPLPAEVQ